MNNKMLHMVAFTLLIVGGVNWLLWGLFNLDLIAKIFGGMPTLAKLLYVLVGLSALYELLNHKSNCTKCSM